MKGTDWPKMPMKFCVAVDAAHARAATRRARTARAAVSPVVIPSRRASSSCDEDPVFGEAARSTTHESEVDDVGRARRGRGRPTVSTLPSTAPSVNRMGTAC